MQLSLRSSLKPKGPGTNDRHIAERILNVATSMPFVLLGVKTLRKDRHASTNHQLLGLSLVSVGVAATSYHAASGSLRRTLRKLDYWSISLCSTLLARALSPQSAFAGAVQMASLAMIPFQPTAVTAANTALMEMKFARSSQRHPALRQAWRQHVMAECFLMMIALRPVCLRLLRASNLQRKGAEETPELEKTWPACACALSDGSSETQSSTPVCVQLQRRAALFSLAATVAAWQPAVNAAPSNLKYGTWDGKSAAGGSCAIGEEGADCRKGLLGRDKLDTGIYGKALSPKAETGTAVAEMDDSYTQETLQVAKAIQKYASGDPFSPERPSIVKNLKQEGGEWASKYARGGNARKQSARKFYIAYDALLGHLVTSGMAPMPQAKLNKVLQNVDEAKQFLAQGR
ncbi:hypothetical protein WJX73_007486 [Symbiochloris irregularis]|uniref:Uncharacterized protein n=1 Tax=Symbiochloris irregularis TaxID=706552 RepID=A0AAW1NKX1_9CHLO